MIFKARGELLTLNYVPHRADMIEICTSCEMEEKETIFHFIGLCEKLSIIGKSVFNQYYLLEEEMIDYLNGKNWLLLYEYCKEAYQFRSTKLCVLD